MVMPRFGALSEFIVEPTFPLQTIINYLVLPEQPIYPLIPRLCPYSRERLSKLRFQVPQAITATLPNSSNQCLDSITCQPYAVHKADKVPALMRFCSGGWGRIYGQTATLIDLSCAWLILLVCPDESCSSRERKARKTLLSWTARKKRQMDSCSPGWQPCRSSCLRPLALE